MSGNELRQEELVVGDYTYGLMPNADKEVYKLFEHQFGYQDTIQRARAAYQRESIATPLADNHIHVLRNHFPPELCQSLIEEYENNSTGIQHPSVLEVLLPQVFNDALDEQIRSYFNSEYCIFWWSIYKVENHNEQEYYYTKWHCDGGPENHLKVITYLNGYEEHGSDTSYLDIEASNALKKVGYLFNNMEDRSTDISPLCQHFDINFNPQSVKPNTGDTILFNPNQLAHRAMPPKVGKPRYVLNFCLLPSEVHWKKVVEEFFFPAYECQDFRDFADISKRITLQSKKRQAHIEVALGYQVENFEHVEFLLANIIKDLSTAVFVAKHIQRQDPNLSECETVFALMRYVKKVILEIGRAHV